MDDVLPVDSSIFLEESKLAKSSDAGLALGTLRVMHHARFTFETATVDIQESNWVPFLEALVPAAGTYLGDIAGPFMADGERLGLVGLGNCHDV